MPADILQKYGTILTNLGFDLVSIFLMTYVLYFRRHWRADLLLAYIALNIGIFATMSVLTQVKVDVAVGFGLFAILSMIRLRSSAVTQQEVAYYFLALVIGLVNGIGVPDRWLLLGINVVLLLVMYGFDRRAFRNRSARMDIKLEGVYTNERALVAELERQLGAHVVYHEITEVNLINRHMTVDVRVRPGEGVIVPPHEKHGHDRAHDRAAQGDAANGAPSSSAPPSSHPSPHPHPAVPVETGTGTSTAGPHDGVARHGA